MANVVDNLTNADPTSDRSPMSEKLYHLISSAIIDGIFPPGMSFTEPELASRYGVSRAPLREALRQLEARQLLERSPYRGMRVVEPSVRMIRELYEIREVLEGLACRRAAHLITPADISRLREMLAEERRTIGSRARSPEDRNGDSRFLGFHTMIAEISGSRELLQLLGSEILRFLRADYRRRLHRTEAIRKGHIEHMAILRALADHDADLAEMLMRRHVANTCMRRERALEEQVTVAPAV